tara:strand:- start:5565 stop:6089 length:525 start_codon:yes stop_codon:yes gene_type:complete
MIYRIGGDTPDIHESVFVAESADVMGKVILKEQSSVWFNAVIRGDCDYIEVGKRSNIQDGAVLHADPGQPLKIGEDVTVGHQAMIHCKSIGDRTLIGIQAVILDGAVVGSDCLIAANALVKAGAVIPDGSMVVGSPGKIIRQTEENMRAMMVAGAQVYVQKARQMHTDLIKVKR